MVSTREIPRAEWPDFFSYFSERHDDEPFDVEVMGSEIGAQTESRNLRLRGISQVRSATDSALAVMFDGNDGTHLTHMVTRPEHVWVLHGGIDTAEVLEIESADGTMTLVHPTAAASPGVASPRMERFPRKGDDEDIPE